LPIDLAQAALLYVRITSCPVSSLSLVLDRVAVSVSNTAPSCKPPRNHVPTYWSAAGAAGAMLV
jgi:hypothetical protein